MNQIPSLGSTASEVLKNALAIETAGFLLKFIVVGEGVWQYHAGTNKFRKMLGACYEEEKDSFDAWLIGEISKGFVGIWLEATGETPWYRKEYHRATGKSLPLGL